jgi:hypothetical protein
VAAGVSRNRKPEVDVVIFFQDMHDSDLKAVFLVPVSMGKIYLQGAMLYIFGVVMRLCQPPDVSTSPKYKLLHF